jgi:hypothetical protein
VIAYRVAVTIATALALVLLTPSVATPVGACSGEHFCDNARLDTSQVARTAPIPTTKETP